MEVPEIVQEEFGVTQTKLQVLSTQRLPIPQHQPTSIYLLDHGMRVIQVDGKVDSSTQDTWYRAETCIGATALVSSSPCIKVPREPQYTHVPESVRKGLRITQEKLRIRGIRTLPNVNTFLLENNTSVLVFDDGAIIWDHGNTSFGYRGIRV